jgi:4-methyl-5(b-hydroxyethyl)-thiazole monophosphate biosynthesis
MTKVLVPIADGSEEMEAVIIIDVLRRAGAEVCVASVMDNRKTVTASRGVRIEADCLLADCVDKTWAMIALPGGMPGAEHLQHCDKLITLIRTQFETHRWLAAICAAPAVVLGRHGLINQFTATCHPAFQQELARYAGQITDDAVVTDNHLITSQGPGTAMLFALTLIASLFNDQKADEIAGGMVAHR